jgi:hypothetical protein
MMRRALVLSAFALFACRDISHFSSGGDSYEGAVVQGDFVRAGIASDARVCMTIDTDHLQDTPGRIWSSDGRFKGVPLRPIPQLWHDPLSTLSFGEGREKNLIYVATPSAVPPDPDIMVFVSLMTSGSIEVRLVRGAPGTSDGASPPSIFGVFQLERHEGSCSF